MQTKIFLIFTIASGYLFAGGLSATTTEQLAAKRVYAHLLIHDPISAAVEAKEMLKSFPNSKQLHFALIRALCEGGNEMEAFEYWQAAAGIFEGEHKSRGLLELLAWGVLNKGDDSNQIAIRVNAMLGASFTHDAKAIPVLLAHLRGSNAWLRSIAVRLSVSYGDAPLQDEIARLLKEERVWYVRLELIRAAGQLRMVKMRPLLKEIIGSSKTLVEEKQAAIIALVDMYESIDRQELKALVNSSRAGLRELACDIVAHLELKEYAGLLIASLNDTSSAVRIAALNALGLLQIDSYKGRSLVSWIAAHLNDSASDAAITAGWLTLVCNDPSGSEILEKWIRNPNPTVSRLASAALSATGKNGVELSLKMIKESSDPYVRANLALGLIGQRTYVKLACNTIYEILTNEKKESWMWDNSANYLFRSLSPSRVQHIDQIPNYPVVIDQMVCLDLLSVLSVMRYPKAQDAVKNFLKCQTWGITGAAAATLLEEGDDEALEIVRGLLNDPDEKIRMQAALILAIFGSDPSAIKVLQEVYPKVDREMKVHILEALAHIGDPDSIPFLIDILKEPFQILRVVAASALIQCLYH